MGMNAIITPEMRKAGELWREFGPGAFHYSPGAFYALHGSSEELLARVASMLDK